MSVGKSEPLNLINNQIASLWWLWKHLSFGSGRFAHMTPVNQQTSHAMTILRHAVGAIWMCLENALRFCAMFRVESALLVSGFIGLRCLGKAKENISRQPLRVLL